jgi:pimeloyl-ACP methyl ester carboxylesterase
MLRARGIGIVWLALSCAQAAHASRIVENEDMPYRTTGSGTVSIAFEAPLMSQGIASLGKSYHLSILQGRGPLTVHAWVQPLPSPLVMVIPGTGASANNRLVLLLAQKLYREGYSVASISSVFDQNWIAAASKTGVPGYTPEDLPEIYKVLGNFQSALKRRFPDRFTRTALVGLSLGAMHTLAVAELESRVEGPKLFDRYVALHPPVDMAHAINNIDGFYEKSPLAWPLDQREDMKERAMTKASLGFIMGTPTQQLMSTFSEPELEYIIGHQFRGSLAAAWVSSQAINDRGLLEAPSSEPESRRREAFARFGFYSYVQQLLLPSTRDQGVTLEWAPWARSVGLLDVLPKLALNPDVRVLHALNDFLLNDISREAIEASIGERAVFFRYGGHLGTLASESFLSEVSAALR